MSFPSSLVNTTNLDATTDSPLAAETDLHAAITALNQIISTQNQAGGVPVLGPDGKLPSAQLSAAAILSALTAVDGAGSTLDADLLDGLQGSAYALLDGSRPFAVGNTGVQVYSTTTGAYVYDILNLQATFSTSPAVGYGLGIGFSGTAQDGYMHQMARIISTWGDASYPAARLSFWVKPSTGVPITEDLRIHDGLLQIREVSTPANADAGTWYLYAKTTGIYARGSGGAEVSLAGGSAADHGSLTGLTDDDHLQYLPISGLRGMTGRLDLGAHPILAGELYADPAAPTTGKWALYFKAGGLYHIDDAGTVTGPFSTGGVVDHGALTGLSDDDHAQYVLRQPAADVAINATQSDFDFVFKTVGAVDMLHIDAALNTVFVNANSAVVDARLYVLGNAGSTALFAYQTDTTTIEAKTSAGWALYTPVTNGGGALFADRAETDTIKQMVYLRDGCHYSGSQTLVIESKAYNPLMILDGNGSELFGILGYESSDHGFVYTYATWQWHSSAMSEWVYLNYVNGRVNIGHNNETAALMNIKGNGLNGLYVIDTGGTTSIKAVADSGTALYGQASTGKALYAVGTANGNVAVIERTVAAASSALLEILAHDAADAGIGLQITQSGTGHPLDAANGDGSLFRVQHAGEIRLKELTSVADTPDAGFRLLYAKTDETFYEKLSDGTERPLGAYLVLKTPVDMVGSVATITVTDAIPGGELKGVLIEVVDEVSGCTSIAVGTAETPNLWATAAAVAAGTKTTHADFEARNIAIYPAGGNVLLTAVGGGALFTAGQVIVKALYLPLQ